MSRSGIFSFLIIALLAVALATGAYAQGTNCIGQVKTSSPGTPVSLTGKVVTAVFPGFFYAQDTEQRHTSCGVMVVSSVVPTITDTVSIEGTLANDLISGEQCISASSVTVTGSAALPKAFGRNNRDAGGSIGISTTGVLQTTWGKASGVVVGQSMLISDGSGSPIKVIGPIYGISDGDYVRVTGIAGLESAGAGRIIRVRDYRDAFVPGTTQPSITNPLIDLDAANLSDGNLASWTNAGALGGIFTSGTSTPAVGTASGRKCVTFADTDTLKASFLAPAGITGNSDYSVVFWAYKTSLWPEMPVVSWAARNGAAGTCAQFNYGNSSGTEAALHGTDPFDMTFGTLKPSANVWHQVAITFDGTTEKTYLDGILSNTETKTLSIAAGQPVYVGSGYSFSGSAFTPEAFLQGSIASLKVYDRALSAADVSQLYSSTSTATRTISGVVFNSGGISGMSGVTICVAPYGPATADPAYAVTTDSTGGYSVLVTPGIWHVSATLIPYQTTLDAVVDVTTANASNVNFLMNANLQTEVVKLDASTLPLGPLSLCANLGTQGGTFTSVGTAPAVQIVGGMRSIVFDGTGCLKSNFTLPAHAAGSWDFWTVTAWVYNSSFQSEETYFSWARSGGLPGTTAKLNYTDSMTLGAVDHGGTFTSGYSAGNPPAGQWHHVAVSYASGTEKIYLDGALLSTVTRPLNVAFGGPAFVGGGYAFDGSSYYPETLFSGAVGQLAFYARALSASTITTLAASDPRPTKVMPLGDSITDGYNIPGGYRIKLWADMLAAGKHIDFVGSMSNGPASLGDKNHEGHGGWTCEGLNNSIDGWMDSAKPRIVLVHIGTNDIYTGATADITLSRLSTLIDKIWAKFNQYSIQDPKIYVGQITPRTDNAALNEIVKQYNAKIPDMVAQKVAAGKRVYMVNMYGDPATNPNGVMPNATDLADQLHPTQVGYDKMGDIWWNAIKDDLLY